MRTYYIGFNDYFHTASIHLSEVSTGLYYLYMLTMWICDKIPSIPFPKCIPWKSSEGWMSMNEWFGDLQQWFHMVVCESVANFSFKHTKSIIIPLPYGYLEELFPEYCQHSSEWDDDDRMFRQLSKELSWKHTDEFKQFLKKLGYEHIKQLCDSQVSWYERKMKGS